jgi:hypothetical protein
VGSVHQILVKSDDQEQPRPARNIGKQGAHIGRPFGPECHASLRQEHKFGPTLGQRLHGLSIGTRRVDGNAPVFGPVSQPIAVHGAEPHPDLGSVLGAEKRGNAESKHQNQRAGRDQDVARAEWFHSQRKREACG